MLVHVTQSDCVNDSSHTFVFFFWMLLGYIPGREPISQQSEGEKRHYGHFSTYSMPIKQIKRAKQVRPNRFEGAREERVEADRHQVNTSDRRKKGESLWVKPWTGEEKDEAVV